MRTITPMMIAGTMMTKMKTWGITEIHHHHQREAIEDGGERDEDRVILMTLMKMRPPVATIKDIKLLRQRAILGSIA